MSSSYTRWIAPTVILSLLGSLWLAPVSPLAISRADLALGQGDAARAVHIYDQVASWTPVAGVRAKALDRAASVYSGELNDAALARTRLEQLLDEVSLSPREQARVHARIGKLLLRERRPARAARSLAMAVELDPDALEAAHRTAESAQAYGEAGMDKKAQSMWRRLLSEHSPWRGRANLGRAQLHLAKGDVVQAMPLFEDVVSHGTSDEQSAAKLGMSVCLEKLGDLDQALVAIVDAELPDGVRRSRTQALRARQAWIP